MRRLKSAGAREANIKLGRTGALWQRAFFNHALRNEGDAIAVARYTIKNYVSADLLERVDAYSFWNAVW